MWAACRCFLSSLRWPCTRSALLNGTPRASLCQTRLPSASLMPVALVCRDHCPGRPSGWKLANPCDTAERAGRARVCAPCDLQTDPLVMRAPRSRSSPRARREGRAPSSRVARGPVQPPPPAGTAARSRRPPRQAGATRPQKPTAPHAGPGTGPTCPSTPPISSRRAQPLWCLEQVRATVRVRVTARMGLGPAKRPAAAERRSGSVILTGQTAKYPQMSERMLGRQRAFTVARAPCEGEDATAWQLGAGLSCFCSRRPRRLGGSMDADGVYEASCVRAHVHAHA